MQSRTTISLLTSCLVWAAACAHQIPDETMDNGDALSGSGGKASAGSGGKAGSTTVLGTSGSSTGSTAGSGGIGAGKGGTGSVLPPAGSGGKAGSGSGGKGGKGGSGGIGAGGMAGSDNGAAGSGDPVNMPVDGLSVTFVPDSTTDEVDFVGGELSVNNEAADPLALADLKVRYYFSNEITEANPDVKPTLMVRWARFGKASNTGDATCTGSVLDAAKPAPGADAYVEMTCSAAMGTDLEEGTLLKISWKAGAQGMGKFSQSDDYSLSDPTKIVVLSGNTVVWGIVP